MKRKGELSINIIIVAAIALLILVIIGALLIRQYSKVNNAVSGEGKCAGGIGHCRVSCNVGEQAVPDVSNECDAGLTCCVGTSQQAS